MDVLGLGFLPVYMSDGPAVDAAAGEVVRDFGQHLIEACWGILLKEWR